MAAPTVSRNGALNQLSTAATAQPASRAGPAKAPSCKVSPHPTSAVEHLVLSTGRALIGPAEAPVELGPGDYISYPGDIPHSYQALVPGTTAVLVLEHR